MNIFSYYIYDMNNLVRDKLCELIKQYGYSLCNDPLRCKGLLSDYCSEYKKEIFVIANAIKQHVARDLLSLKGVPYEIKRGQLINRLIDNIAMDEEAARWAVETLALALGIISNAEITSSYKKQSKSQNEPIFNPKDAKTNNRIDDIKKQRISKSSDGRYIDNGDGTITDSQTGLMWTQKDNSADNIKLSSRKDADIYVSRLATGGYRDWRFPKQKELKEIRERLKTSNVIVEANYDHIKHEQTYVTYKLHLDPIFKIGISFCYWTSDRGNIIEGYKVCFGLLNAFNAFNRYNIINLGHMVGIRAVRNGH